VRSSLALMIASVLGLGGLACGGDSPADPDGGRPPAPLNPEAAPEPGRVALRWEPGGDDARVERYNVWRSTSGSGTWTRIASTSSTSYTDSAVSPGTSYVYGVRAVGAEGKVSESSELVQTTAVLLDGSVFGPGPGVTPYLSAGAQGAGYSLTDPDAHGAVVVPDPADARRKVIKLTTDEAEGDGDVVRMQLNGRKLLGEGAGVWIVAEYYLPATFPTLPPRGWLTLGSVYGSPHGGAGPNSIQLRSLGGRNYLHWKDEATDTRADLWRRPATRGRWHVVARRMRMSSDASKGFMEIWYAERGRPLRRQTLRGPAAGKKRRYYRTLEPGVNWDTDRGSDTYHEPNSANISNYHKDGMPGWSGLNSVYVAGHKVYPGRARVRQVDPYTRRGR
jgi:hypothetical protein